MNDDLDVKSRYEGEQVILIVELTPEQEERIVQRVVEAFLAMLRPKGIEQ